MGPLTALILAGGRGRRFDGADKGLLPFGSGVLIEQAIAQLTPQVDQILISANRNHHHYAGFGLPVLRDSDQLEPYPGPLGGMLAALEWSRDPLLLVVPGDAPWIAPDLAARLRQALLQQQAMVAVADDGERLQPLHALLRRELLTPLRQALMQRQRRVIDWYQQQRWVAVPFADRRRQFYNFNYLTHYQRPATAAVAMTISEPTDRSPCSMSLMPFPEAKQRLLAAAHPITDQQQLPLEAATGRILAAPLLAPLTLPPFDNAAMDGYAVRCSDLTAAATTLPISQRIAAGDVAQPLAAGTAARIFTGAQLPEGADAVVMQEACERDGSHVTIQHRPYPWQHVRQRGSNLQQGAELLPAGYRLDGAALGLVASMGIAILPLLRRLRVALLFTGSELVEPGRPLPPGHIYNANRHLMRGFLQRCGVELIDLGTIEDNYDRLTQRLHEAAADADLILTSGGMSVGEEDHVIQAVAAAGAIDVWKIAAKPGKPFGFGHLRSGDRQVPFIGLPGNPVAVWVGLVTLVAPFLNRLQGRDPIEPEPLRLRSEFHYQVRGNRTEFVRVRRTADGGLACYPNQDSAVLMSAVWGDGLTPIAAGSSVNPGDPLDFIPIPEGW